MFALRCNNCLGEFNSKTDSFQKEFRCPWCLSKEFTVEYGDCDECHQETNSEVKWIRKTGNLIGICGLCAKRYAKYS